MYKIFFSMFCIFLIPFICSCEKRLSKALMEDLDLIQPDRRTTVYNLDYKFKDGQWLFDLETSDSMHISNLQNVLNKNLSMNEFKVDINFLPDSVFADTIYGLVNVSVGNLRREPRHSAELVDQVLMGMPLKLFKKNRYWFLVQTPYQYLGWIPQGSIKRMSLEELQEYNKSEKFMMDTNFEIILSEPVRGSQPVSDAVLGCVFRGAGRSGMWMRVMLPDGRQGYLPSISLKSYQAYSNKLTGDSQNLISRARRFMGIPYLWGGHSTKGFDCSGFTSTVFRTTGYQLPRDANMQVKQGQEVVPNQDYSNIFPGDLIFFGPPDRITHVGICLGGSYFIHCSGDVHINSLDENDELFNRYRKETFRTIKRIFEN